MNYDIGAVIVIDVAFKMKNTSMNEQPSVAKGGLQ